METATQETLVLFPQVKMAIPAHERPSRTINRVVSALQKIKAGDEAVAQFRRLTSQGSTRDVRKVVSMWVDVVPAGTKLPKAEAVVEAGASVTSVLAKYADTPEPGAPVHAPDAVVTLDELANTELGRANAESWNEVPAVKAAREKATVMYPHLVLVANDKNGEPLSHKELGVRAVWLLMDAGVVASEVYRFTQRMHCSKRDALLPLVRKWFTVQE